MGKKLLMGNEAIARGAVEAGLNLATAYPGTPSSEIIGTLAEWSGDFDYYVEWSVNEKVAMEVAGGAAYAGGRALVAMKQVGLNVASDPLMSLAYIGVQGALVVVVADDPGPHSSQTEQDTRVFAKFAKLPVFDPSSPEEALAMTKAAFELSHRYQLPVLLRPTTRVCHATSGIEFGPRIPNVPEGFVKDPKWVIFPRLSYQQHQLLEETRLRLEREFSDGPWNPLTPGDRIGIVAGGVSYLYAREAVARLGLNPTMLKVGTPHPLPTAKLEQFLSRVDRVFVLEELDPVLEEGIIALAGQVGFKGPIYGKRSGHFPWAGEYSADRIQSVLARTLELAPAAPEPGAQDVPPELPVRPPVLCAGCPHRASFYAVKRGSRGSNAIYTGDIGCYTLGNAPPLSMVDTCLCMGAGLTVGQGLLRMEPGRPVFAFIGDSTFFHTGIPGILNAVYNQHPIKLVLLDNSTTAMTGHQPHPGMGRTACGGAVPQVDPVAVLRACGVEWLEVLDPLDLPATEAAVRRALEYPGVVALVLKSPCVATFKATRRYRIDSAACSNCGRCLRELGCPAFYREEKPQIGPSCYGCGLCSQICPKGAIGEVGRS
ncbi:indolepyruvate ferredoxin oxidoreductase alpha subunit [Hydrogenispora ethanolica]|uniref:Indolepyruvate oxidoreductase subunit IorA n=1 Tax=Hydrogenispora ethanolica TaxID=1082276 RepID=A0A4R1R8N6_HYDET|nr:indolepyruvate ferredoxin oxidoreductase subunit alpha [Hydrogenispora ethanolica]TCL62016.1 indolepyruvate ferredoxin oxidoreductase alpha subunit [Hydrogenispora ethanolica]